MRAWLLLSPLFFILLSFFLIPEADMLVSSFRAPLWTIKNYARLLGSSHYLGVLGSTLIAGIAVTSAALFIGTPVAYWLARLETRRASVLLLIATFPLWVSSVIRSFAWIVLLGRGGVLSVVLQAIGFVNHPVQLLYTMGGVVIALTQVMLPIAVFSLYGVFKTIDPELERAAQNLGASPAKAALLVALPMAVGGLQSTGLLVFALSAAAFTTPSIIGGARMQFMSTTIYEQALDLADWPFASAVACLLLTVGLVVALLLVRLESGMGKR